MTPPDFWRRGGHPAPKIALYPLSLGWRALAALNRARQTPRAAAVPVICVGNLNLGGDGKTPTVRMIVDWFAKRGRRAGVLARGYGGRLSGQTPVRVDPVAHTAAETGDESLLHVASGPVVICADRVAGARLLADECDLIVMDDGHQNRGLIKQLSLLVVNADAGFGNGAVIPAGPLRETVSAGLARADAVILVGDGAPDARITAAGLPVLRMRPEPVGAPVSGPVVAFCGIARPEGFRHTLAATGARICGFHAFPDHHPYDAAELQALRTEAEQQGARLVTTEKDLVRVPVGLRDGLAVAKIRMTPAHPAQLDELLQPLLDSLPVNASAAAPPNRSE